MNTAEMLVAARSNATSAEQLAGMVGAALEVDRMIAGHPNATADLLETLMYRETEDGGFDDEIQRVVVRHANVSVDAFRALARSHAEDALQNPALADLLGREPDLLDDLPCLLEDRRCPDFLIDLASSSESTRLHLSLLRNDALPAEIRDRLGPASVNKGAVATLREFQASQIDEDDRRYVATYIEVCRPQNFCLPVFLPFDSSNHEHRLGDQVICGVPFTSEAWPWPVDNCGGHLQPVAQIDLTLAGKTLDERFGDGLLQVWMAVDPNPAKPGSWDPELRVIPPADLAAPMTDEAPNGKRWNAERREDVSGDCVFGFEPVLVPSARVKWLPVGAMYPRPLCVLSEWAAQNTTLGDRRQEQLSDSIEDLGLPMASTSYLDPKTLCIRLGGYPLGWGNEADLGYWRDNPERMLLYVSDEDGFLTLAVTYVYAPNGHPKFRSRMSSNG